MVTAPKNLNPTQRAAYSLAIITDGKSLTDAGKHQLGMDAVMAHDLSVPGLDRYVMKLESQGQQKWDGSGRNREFARHLDKGVTLKPAWQLTLPKILGGNR